MNQKNTKINADQIKNLHFVEEQSIFIEKKKRKEKWKMENKVNAAEIFGKMFLTIK